MTLLMPHPSSYGEAENFKFRVAGIGFDRGRVLIHRAEYDDFWALPGGHVELNEPSNVTLKREMNEEIGEEVEIKRLVFVAEDFYEYQDKDHHELALYYLMELPEDSEIREKERFYGREDEYWGTETELKLIFRWYPLEELDDLNIYPTFLREKLKDLPDGTEHIIHGD